MLGARPPKPSGPSFFPALTHFTDAVDALPRELIKHFSMLKEVEAKAHDPEANIQSLLQTIDKLPVPTRVERAQESGTGNNSAAASVAGSVARDSLSLHQQLSVELFPPNYESLEPAQQASLYRRQLFYRLRFMIYSMLGTLDEKIVVLSTANQSLSKGLARMESSYQHLGEEINDEARYGSKHHWAYIDLREDKKKANASERSRREVASTQNLAAAAAAVENDFSSRSELRREAILQAKKSRGRQAQLDSDFDERPGPKRSQNSKTSSKPIPTHRKPLGNDAKVAGLGITNTTNQSTKKRRIDKEDSAPGMERSLSAALNQAGTTRGGASPRETPGAEGSKKRKVVPSAPAPAKKKYVAVGYSYFCDY
jgi:hypothetical protein